MTSTPNNDADVRTVSEAAKVDKYEHEFYRSAGSYLVGTAALKNGSSGILVYDMNVRKDDRPNTHIHLEVKGTYSLLVPVPADEVCPSTLANRVMSKHLYICGNHGHTLTAISSSHKKYVFLKDRSAGELPDEIASVDYACLRETAETTRWLASPVTTTERGRYIIMSECFLDEHVFLSSLPWYIRDGFVLIGGGKEMTDEEKHRAERLMTDAIDGYLAGTILGSALD